MASKTTTGKKRGRPRKDWSKERTRARELLSDMTNGSGKETSTGVSKETGASKETVGRADALASSTGLMPFQEIGNDLPEGMNRKIIAIGLKILALPEVDLNNLEQVSKRLSEYLQIYMNADMKPTVTGMANALFIDRRRLWEIATNQQNPQIKINPDCAAMIARTYHLLNQYWEEYMQTGKINPVSGIFLGKNHFGYKDQSDFVVTAHTDETTLDSESIRGKYIDS